MLSAMEPRLTEDPYVFCSVDPELARRLLPEAEGTLKEEEGTTLILSLGRARALGFDTSLPLRRIVLNVYSALDGVGLTASVASALADEGIACNVVAGFHHDHLFIPESAAATALATLRRVQHTAAEKTDSTKKPVIDRSF